MTAPGLVITFLMVLGMAVLVLLGPRRAARRPPPTEDRTPAPPHDQS
ncbi:hypothetical protein ACFYZ9_28450 [Streptomyces sp. NPDC001691]|nr:hypothetical protein [Streptomyces lavendulae]